jgi:hypothetical protein
MLGGLSEILWDGSRGCLVSNSRRGIPMLSALGMLSRSNFSSLPLVAAGDAYDTNTRRVQFDRSVAFVGLLIHPKNDIPGRHPPTYCTDGNGDLRVTNTGGNYR